MDINIDERDVPFTAPASKKSASNNNEGNDDWGLTEFHPSPLRGFDDMLETSLNVVAWAKSKIGKIDAAMLHNSTSSIKLDSHIGRPDFGKLIICVAMVIQCQVLEGYREVEQVGVLRIFDEDYFKDLVDDGDIRMSSARHGRPPPPPQGKGMGDERNGGVSMSVPPPANGLLVMGARQFLLVAQDVSSSASSIDGVLEGGSHSRNKRTRIESRVYPVPTLVDIVRLFSTLCHSNRVNAECGIVALIYLNRLRTSSGLRLHPGNYKPLIITSLFIAQKMWQDSHQRSSTFSKDSGISAKALRFLESKFIDMIEFDTFINRSTYSKYYYELRSLGFEKADMKMQEMSPADAARLEIRTQRVGYPPAKKGKQKKRSKCLEDIDFVKPKSRYVLS